MTLDERTDPKADERLALEALFADAPIGLAVLDAELRFLRVNGHLARLNGLAEDEHAGRPVADLLPGMGGELAAALRRVLETGKPISDSAVTGETPAAPGVQRSWRASAHPLRGPDGAITGVAVAVVDTTQQDRVEAELAAILRQLDTERTRLEAVLRQMPAGLIIAEAPSGKLILGNDQVERIWRKPFLASGDVERYGEWEGFHADGRPYEPDEWPLARSVRSGEVVKGEEIEILRGDGTRAVVRTTSAPIRDADGQIVAGVVSFEDVTAEKRAEAERERLLESEHEARLRAEQAERRSRFLAEAGAALAASLDYEATLRNVTRLAVPELADWCMIDMAEPDGSIRRLSVAHVDPDQEEHVAELQRRWPTPHDADYGVPQVIRTGEPQLLPEIPRELLERVAQDAEHLRTLRELELRSAMAVPLRARGRTLGAITFASSQPGRHYGEEDLRLAESLASRCALAVDNARLYEARTYIARTLQQSLLPSHMPEIPGVEVAARYRAAGAGTDVGGDFFDVFETGDGGWAIAVGDVTGKGADAAAITALARYTMRAAVLYERSPEAVLRFLNDAMLRQRLTDRFCTVGLAVLREDGDRTTVEVTSGGHPLPLVVRDGEVRPIGRPGTLLGVTPELHLHEEKVALEPGDQLVLYTDGVTEARPGGEMLGMEGLAVLLEDAAGLDAAATAEHIESAVVGDDGDPARDDVAILVVQARGAAPERRGTEAIERAGGIDRQLNLRVAGGSGAPSVAREALSDLEDALGPKLFFSTRLLLTELVTNSVRHAHAGPSESIGLEVRLSPDGVRVEVTDQGPGFRVHPIGVPAEEAAGGRGLFLVDQIADRWGMRDGGNRVWFEIDGAEGRDYAHLSDPAPSP